MPSSNRRRLDLPVAAAGGLLAGGAAVGLAVLFESWAPSEGPDVGPTAASLDEASLGYLGAAVGLALGSAAASFATRHGPRRYVGVLAGAFGFAAVVLPVFAATSPSDLSAGEVVSTGLFLALLLAPAVVIGALVGGFRG